MGLPLRDRREGEVVGVDVVGLVKKKRRMVGRTASVWFSRAELLANDAYSRLHVDSVETANHIRTFALLNIAAGRILNFQLYFCFPQYRSHQERSEWLHAAVQSAAS